MNERLIVDRLGAQGDGIAERGQGAVFVPYALAGETVTAEVKGNRATLLSVEEASPLRIEPACRHFGTCGGCAIQHLEADAYRAWKRDIVLQTLHSRGIEARVDELVPCAPHSRRRATFAARRTEAGMLLGFNRANSGEIVAIEECPIMVPAIESALGGLRRVAEAVCATGQPFHLGVTATASGLDVAATDSGRLDDERRRAAIRVAMQEGLARLSVDGEVLIEPRKPQVAFDGISVALPPGSFLQATESAENAMAALVTAHLSRARAVADLFSGCGTFALRLSRKSAVHAVEGDAAALVALDRGAREASGLKRVTTQRRDLFRRPLTFKELARFDGLVFDPPRAGAEEQARQIARSEIPAVVAVSCAPATLARDLRILVDGGYRVASVTPIDQFLWSPHVEAVALLEKPKKRR